MTEIEFRPIKKVVILEDIMYENLEEFILNSVTGMPPDVPVILLWAEGVVFQHSALPPSSDSLIKERIKGIVYWSFVRYARMDEYQKEVTVGPYTVKILKATAPALIDVARALKAKLTSKTH